MSVRIAIPQPSSDSEYNARSLPPYLEALKSAGAEPVVIPLDNRQDHVAQLLAETQGVLLPGSKFDVDPERYGEARIAACGPTDPGRTAVDELLLQDAFNLRKPILAICHGAQTLNVWLNGSLIQDLPTILGTKLNHAPGRDIVNAHPISITAGSRLASIAARATAAGGKREWQVNSSHHQAIGRVGDNLQISAVSTQDGVIEAVELYASDHFVLGLQWHPERTLTIDPLSGAIFAYFICEARTSLSARIAPLVDGK